MQQRKKLLEQLVRFERPVEELSAALEPFGIDCEIALKRITTPVTDAMIIVGGARVLKPAGASWDRSKWEEAGIDRCSILELYSSFGLASP